MDWACFVRSVGKELLSTVQSKNCDSIAETLVVRNSVEEFVRRERRDCRACGMRYGDSESTTRERQGARSRCECVLGLSRTTLR